MKRFKNCTYVERTFETELFVTLESLWVDKNGKVVAKYTDTQPKVLTVTWQDLVAHDKLRLSL